MKHRFDKMLLRTNSTLGDIQAGFMKLIPMYSLKRSKNASITNGFAKYDQITAGSSTQRERSGIIELESTPNNKIKSKRKPRTRNNSVKVVNRSQAKAMSSLQALRAANLPKSSMSLSPDYSNGVRYSSDSSTNSSSRSPYLDEELLPYTLTVDVSQFQMQNQDTHAMRRHSLETRKVRFH